MPTSVLTVLSKVIVNTSIQGTGTYAGNGVQAAITTNVNSGTTGLGTNNPVSIATGLVAGQFAWMVSLTLNVISGTPYVLDLDATFNDICGQAVVGATNLCFWEVMNNGAVGNIVVGGGSNPVLGSDQITVGPSLSTQITGVASNLNTNPGWVIGSGAANWRMIASTGTISATFTLAGN